MQKGRQRTFFKLIIVSVMREMRKRLVWWWIISNIHGWTKQLQICSVFISALNRKDRLGNPTRVTKTVGVENRATAIFNKVAFRKKIFSTKEITEYNTYEVECLFYHNCLLLQRTEAQSRFGRSCWVWLLISQMIITSKLKWMERSRL